MSTRIASNRIARSRLAIATLALGASTLSGCALTKSNAGKGVLIGAATGAAAGGAIGSKNGGTARGAIIGAAIGGAAGAIIGHQMDKQAKEIAQNIPGATVERVGEGIEVTFASGLLYDYDSDRVKSDAASNLRTLAQSLDKYPDTELVIVGHTDDRGTDEYNLDLSQRRATAAATYLVSQGVSRSRIRPVGRGEAEPKVANDTEADRALNRRVEVAIFANDKLQQKAKQQAFTGTPGF
jgi:outer membrane protein OmpA-like peptidoglycan-associated protein